MGGLCEWRSFWAVVFIGGSLCERRCLRAVVFVGGGLFWRRSLSAAVFFCSAVVVISVSCALGSAFCLVRHVGDADRYPLTDAKVTS